MTICRYCNKPLGFHCENCNPLGMHKECVKKQLDELLKEVKLERNKEKK